MLFDKVKIKGLLASGNLKVKLKVNVSPFKTRFNAIRVSGTLETTDEFKNVTGDTWAKACESICGTKYRIGIWLSPPSFDAQLTNEIIWGNSCCMTKELVNCKSKVTTAVWPGAKLPVGPSINWIPVPSNKDVPVYGRETPVEVVTHNTDVLEMSVLLSVPFNEISKAWPSPTIN